MMLSALIAGLIVGISNAKVKTLEDGYTKEALGDAITSLPGLDTNIFNKYTMFSGYIDVYPSHNRSLFYWFVESLNNPAKDPVALWTNGGPGCSGLGGMFVENGPFRLNTNLMLQVNPYSWVNVSNMIFIEAPAGVGFSYSDVGTDYITDDNKTAIDNYNLIRGWLNKFPNYHSNDFYITSESYGGHYMPTLGKQIILGNNAGNTPQINFKGIFLGNPFTDPDENAKGTYDTFWGHQLVSYPTYKKWISSCEDGDIDNPKCFAAQLQMNAEVGENIDPYALDYPTCTSSNDTRADLTFINKFWFMKENYKALHRPLSLKYQRILDKKIDKNIKFDNSNNYNMNYEPCAQNYLPEYFNQLNVQTAIHAKSVLHWSECGGIDYSFVSQRNPMEPTWKWLFNNANNGTKFTIISGDDDSVCGTLGTQSWIYNLGYPIDSNWTAWTDEDGQTGGYLIKFKYSLNFVTVHSAGHMIPQTQPSRSLQAFKRYLSGAF